MQKLVRLGPPMKGLCRTIERHGKDLELLETVAVVVSSWKSSGGPQRWLSLQLMDGSHKDLELFVPLEAFTGELGKSSITLASELLVEGRQR